jgi:integrase
LEGKSEEERRTKMALFQECPRCKEKLSFKYQVEVKEGEQAKKGWKERSQCPRCGFKLRKASGKVYWIEYYLNGKRKRERIGPNKEAAEQRLREVLKLRTEERYIDKDPAARMHLGELCKWYLELPEVKAKDSYDRDEDFIANLKRLLGEDAKIKDITSGKIESYQTQRLAEPSSAHPGQTIRPCTVNKEVSCLKWIFNRAIRHGKLEHNPVNGVKRLPENNVRMRVLTQKEFDLLLEKCDKRLQHLRPVVAMGYYMGMRRSEVLNLTWPEVDLKKGFIRLSAERTKTDSPRVIPIHPKVKAILEKLPRGLHTDRVFLRRGKPFDEIKNSFQSACDEAGIKDFTFHDLRHCALNNLRLAGNDYFKIMSMSGHKTMSVFKRYNLVTEEELSRIKWPGEGRIAGTMDTNMDTSEKKEANQNG